MMDASQLGVYHILALQLFYMIQLRLLSSASRVRSSCHCESADFVATETGSCPAVNVGTSVLVYVALRE